jgi:hypothetical protein
VGASCFGRHPYTDSRVQLTEGRRMHNCGCGDVLSSWAPTALGMVLQCSKWWHNGEDGRTGPEVTEETRSTGPTSQRRPVRVRAGVRTPFEGSAVLFRGVRHAGHT